MTISGSNKNQSDVYPKRTAIQNRGEQENTQGLRKSTRERRTPAKYSDYELLYAEEAEPSILVSEFSESSTYKAALKDVNSDNDKQRCEKKWILCSRIEPRIWYLFRQIENHSGTSRYIV